MSGKNDERHQSLDLLVLATRPLGDHDRIIRLLASGIGRLDAVARGAGRARHRFQGKLEPFTRLKAAAYRRAGGDLWTLREAETISLPPSMPEWRRIVALQSAAELLLHSGPYEGMLKEFYALAVLFPSLLESARDPVAATAAFAVRWSLISGYGLPSTTGPRNAREASDQANAFFQRAATDPPEHWSRYVLARETSRAVAGTLQGHVESHVERAWKGWRLLADSPAAPRS